jgi:thymidylate kinase
MNKRKNIFICIIGIDGSGKTTHAKALCSELSQNNVNCAHVSPRSSLVRFFFGAKNDWLDRHDNVGPRKFTLPKLNSAKSGNKRVSDVLKIPFSLIIIAYTYLTYLVTIRPILLEKTVVSDRYFYDLFYNLWGGKSYVFSAILPKPTMGFILDIPVSLAIERMHSQTDKKIPEEYHQELRKYYLSFEGQNGFQTIDAKKDFKTANASILKAVQAILSKRDA